MLKKWDDYTMDTINEPIGHGIIRDDQNLAKMILDYVQNHRVYN
ncbi:hypothetical protein L915_06736 [Phytophthora nicotianae]|uniref:Uncharacterized protein n=1 Tax=Phytophthora nicotianae TaxID=4792 RepID=W2J7Z5_PHYNI|nr:hypothetical protein L915_06736 [Phytophthora nicotianae]ETL42524.1 hypothetical protein L916_06674 [Phytophthora nicotianae]